MTSTEKYLIAAGLNDNLTFDEYCERVPDFFFKKEVPKDVIACFDVAHRLLIHSYYEYQFIDQALLKVLQTLEMAMYIKYQEMWGVPKKELTFYEVIQALCALEQFDTSEEMLHSIRYLRNRYSHPKWHSYSGIALWNKIIQINYIVNEMYADMELRSERKELFDRFIQNQTTRGLHHRLFFQTSEGRRSLYELRLVFLDNKEVPHIYHLALVPLFNLEKIVEGHTRVPKVHHVKVIHPEFREGGLEVQVEDTGQKVSFHSLKHDMELNTEFAKWVEELGADWYKVIYQSGIDMRVSQIHFPVYCSFGEK